VSSGVRGTVGKATILEGTLATPVGKLAGSAAAFVVGKGTRPSVRLVARKVTGIHLVVSRGLRAARAGKRLTQQQLAEAMTEAGVPMTKWTIADIEKDERRVSLDELVGFCTVLDVTLADLLRGREGETARRALGL
jgi:DNA-binding XRE family transcriptional regulator